jgi:hypothetical protein
MFVLEPFNNKRKPLKIAAFFCSFNLQINWNTAVGFYAGSADPAKLNELTKEKSHALNQLSKAIRLAGLVSALIAFSIYESTQLSRHIKANHPRQSPPLNPTKPLTSNCTLSPSKFLIPYGFSFTFMEWRGVFCYRRQHITQFPKPYKKHRRLMQKDGKY